MKINKTVKNILLLYSVIAFIGPNALYIYTTFTNPSLNLEAINNPIALVFMIEAMMLLSLFLIYVYIKTQSIKKVIHYLFLSFIGSLAFSLPLFLYLNSELFNSKNSNE